jgi:putative SOS response-associated peptidase YedK
MALTGVWEDWRSPAGEVGAHFAIVTTEPNALCVQLHDCMPVVLGPENWKRWLAEEPTDASSLRPWSRPYPADEMTCRPSSPRVGNVKNNHPNRSSRPRRNEPQ